MFGIDDALGDVVASSTQPALGAIRLAWWREALQRLDTAPPPPEPRLQAAAAELLPRGLTGEALATLEDGWSALLEEVPDRERAAARGAALFRLAAKLLDTENNMLDAAGRLFARSDLARRGLDVLPPPMTELAELRAYQFPRPLRPLTTLAKLAARDVRRWPSLEAEATPGRAARLLAHRLFGFVS